MNIVFDFGNVLFEWNPVRLIDEHFPTIAPLPCTPEIFSQRLINEDWLAYDTGLIDTETVAARCASAVGVAASDLQRFVEQLPHVLQTIDPTVRLMQALASGKHGAHRVLYLSNMPILFAEVLEAKYPWIADFHDGIFSGRVKMAKPDAVIYEHAEHTLNLIPSETLFLDDMPRNVNAARARGWLAEIISGPQSTRDALTRHGVLR